MSSIKNEEIGKRKSFQTKNGLLSSEQIDEILGELKDHLTATFAGYLTLFAFGLWHVGALFG